MVMLADVAGEAHARAVGRDVDLLVDVGAVELQRVVAGLAFDDVAAVAGVPDEGVVARAHQRHVVAAAADDQVVALAADEVSSPSPPLIVQADRVGLERAGVDDVVAAQAVDGRARSLGSRVEDGDGCRQAR